MDHQHPWLVTAPWYDWKRPGVPDSGRGTRPSIQKFASDEFIAEFLKEPQRSLLFDTNGADAVRSIELGSLPGSGLAARLAALAGRSARLASGASGASAVSSGLRKLYLPTHARHYLLVCELHCDQPGLPPPGRDSVCQAGFVVRRTRLGYAPQFRGEALALLREVSAAQARLGELDERAPLRAGLAAARASRLLRLKRQGTFAGEQAEALAALKSARGKLEAWQLERGVRAFKEGWFPGAHQGVGEWRELDEETPQQQVQESWLRLFPLSADPRAPRHSARGRALFYAVVPTSAFDTTAHGEPRFDDQASYELRCFFRQHDACCPFPGLNAETQADCEGPLTWSEPSQPYRLAPQLDLLGTANRPVTIQMPNLAELAAQAGASPIGQFSPVRFVHSQQLQSKTDGGIPTSGSIGGPAICFFSIPLITIVASFVLNLFLPIVVLLFNLWFLLAMRFCIPPSFSIDAGLQAALDAIPPDADISAELAATLRPPLLAGLAANLNETTGIPTAKIAPQLDSLPLDALATLGRVQAEKAQQQPAPDGSAQTALNPTGGLVFRDLVVSQWKHEKHLPTTGEFA